MNPLRYRAVLFDLDGTLVDSYSALTDAVNFARRGEGMPELEVSRVKELVGDGVDVMLRRALDPSEVSSRTRSAFESRYDEVCCAQSTVLGDVESTLAALAARNVVMAVCTNKPTSFSRKILEALSLARYFRAIVGPDMAGARKPDGRHVLASLAATGCATDEALFVGDMPVDIAAARNGGVAVAVVATGSSTGDQLRAAGPDYYLERFADLLEVVGCGAASA